MNIFVKYPLGITKLENELFYQSANLANKVTVYANIPMEQNVTYFLSLEFLRSDNRKTTIYTRDAFAEGEDTTYTENSVVYDIHNFTLTETQLAAAGALAITCYINFVKNEAVVKRGVLFNVIANVKKTVAWSQDSILVLDNEEENATIVTDMLQAIETINAILSTKANINGSSLQDFSVKDLTATSILLSGSATIGGTTYNSDSIEKGLYSLSIPDKTGTIATTGDVADEATARTNADAALQSSIQGNYNRILQEVLARSNADTNLQNQINTLKSVQNVVDVVATYAALQSYVTTNLDANDKVQVIADETHSNASAVYNWNGSAWEYVGAYGTNSYTKTETLEQIDLHKLVNKTYSELATLKSGNNLVAGQLYRITDYVTKTNGVCNGVANDVRSMEHPFDIVLRAISNNKFSENARALLHSGDTYFANSNLNSWQLWYCFENDTNRFEWADTLTGKGVIYRMIDEFGNDLPYDFKNIKFKRYKITATTDSRHSNAIGKYLGFSGNYNCTSDSTDYVWHFTFSKRADGTDLSLTETTAPSYTNCYYVKEVKIGEYLSDTPNYRGIQALNNIVFECDNIVVDVQMGVCSHHNTFIGNKDITYVYFKEMCRNNIVYGEMSHARADECFEQNMMGDFVALSQYTLCWNKFSHHFARNIAVQMQSNDFEAQVSDCKFPENFTRNHIFNMWGSVDASTHDTFNRCELGLFSYTTLSGGGTWDGVYGISLDHCTIKIANLFGSKLGRMEYVSISEGVNNFNVLNLTVGALFGSSSKVLTIALTDLTSYQIASVYEKKIDFANETVNNLRGLIYTWAKYSVAENIVDYGAVRGTISSVDGTVTWTAMDSIYSTMTNMVDGKMNKANPTGTGSISMNSGTASGTSSYANGSGATASGSFSRAIGFGAQASGSYSTAIIGNASGSGAIAIGNMANASGDNSKALGDGARAKGDNQTVIGKFNIPDTSSLEIIGNGAYMNTSNARLLDANGNEYLKGDIYVNSTFTKDANGDLDTKSGTKLVAVSANPTLAGTEADLTGLEVDGTKYKVSSGGGSGTTVVANPTLQGGEADLTSITIGNTNYAIPSGSGGGSTLYTHLITLAVDNTYASFSIISKKNSAFTFSELQTFLETNLQALQGWQGGYPACSAKNNDTKIVTSVIGYSGYIHAYYYDVSQSKMVRSSAIQSNTTIRDIYTEVV